MRLKFKVQLFQTSPVESVVDCFAGQVNTSGIAYRIDPGMVKSRAGQIQAELYEMQGFKNADFQLTDTLDQVHCRGAQHRHPGRRV